MNLVILTTETSHHAFFVQQMAQTFSVRAVLLECRGATADFETFHPFEDRREKFEAQHFFDGRIRHCADFAEVCEVQSANEPDSVKLLRGLAPEVMVVFGTRRLSAEAIAICPQGIVNLHGGDPETYRGLDTHLWAIYHGEFHELQVTLHRVNERLDDGEIILRRPVRLHEGMKLHELRGSTTRLCVELTSQALQARRRAGRFDARPQKRHGRYYSHMPSVLKEQCVRRFETYTRGL